MIDFDRHGPVADIGMHCIGKIHGRGPARQGHDLAFGGEDIDFVREQIDLDVFQKFGSVAALVLDFEQVLQPLVGFLLHVADACFAALVKPVRGHARLGDLVHFLAADLDFDGRAERAKQRGVQRLVAIRLGDGDVILEFSRNRLVQAVQGAQGEIAGRYVLDGDAETVDVEYLGKGQVFFLHLAVNAVEMLFASGDAGFDIAAG